MSYYQENEHENICKKFNSKYSLKVYLSKYGYGLGCLYEEYSMLFSSIFSHFPILLRLYQADLIKDIDTIAKLEKEVTIL